MSSAFPALRTSAKSGEERWQKLADEGLEVAFGHRGAAGGRRIAIVSPDVKEDRRAVTGGDVGVGVVGDEELE